MNVFIPKIFTFQEKQWPDWFHWDRLVRSQLVSGEGELELLVQQPFCWLGFRFVTSCPLSFPSHPERPAVTQPSWTSPAAEWEPAASVCPRVSCRKHERVERLRRSFLQTSLTPAHAASQPAAPDSLLAAKLELFIPRFQQPRPKRAQDGGRAQPRPSSRAPCVTAAFQMWPVNTSALPVSREDGDSAGVI